MLEQFQKTLRELTGMDPVGQRFLLAVSGGLDSVVLAHLFSDSGSDFGIAHCNFCLRGAESDADEAFVRQLASSLNVPFFVKTFDTYGFLKEHGGSVQMAARALRYPWLEQLRVQEHFDWLVTAHHVNDSIESFFINFLRGSGLRGLSGIPDRNARIIRPLAYFPRTQLENLYREKKLSHREDRSNAETDYLRNKIRHLLIPVLRQIHPGFEDSAARTLKNLRGALDLYDHAIHEIREKAMRRVNQRIFLDWPFLADHPAAETICFELLRSFGFTGEQVREIWKRKDGQAGKFFFSPEFQLLVDRETFILENRNNSKNTLAVSLEGPGMFFVPGGRLHLEWCAGGETLKLPEDSSEIMVHAEALRFPLRWRIWEAGDVFCPIGLEGHSKKVQDFLTDCRLDRLKKEQVRVLENADGRIVWIAGYRMDERFKLDLNARLPYWRIHYFPE